MDKYKKDILFLCTGNSCRSQMAEGWARKLWSNEINPYSAGIEAHGINPYALKVMAEIGIDISDHCSKTVNQLPISQFALVVTVCDHADKHCPLFPGRVEIIRRYFADPPQQAAILAARGANEETQLDCYRKVRDEIGRFIAIELPGHLGFTGRK